MRVLVCGGRDFSDYNYLSATLDAAIQYGHFDIDLVIHGNARGADLLAAKWARENDIQDMSFPAEWKRYGNAAGPIRNQRMLDEGKPDLVIAFPGGRGTADMIRRAKNAGIDVEQVTP